MNPDDRLYIYYVRGVVSYQDEKGLGQNFLGNWPEGDHSFLFFRSPSLVSVMELIKKRSDLELIDQFELTYKDWQDHVSKPFCIENIIIAPPWYNASINDNDLLIILDPGLVFGSGIHPTTRDCIKAIISLKDKIKGKTVVDLGTGTGILSLICALMGAEKIIGVDINPMAVRTAKHNVDLNGFSDKVLVIQADAVDTLCIDSHIIIANLNCAVVEKIIESRYFREKEYAIISGLMRSDSGRIQDVIKRNQFKIVSCWDHEFTWFTYLICI
jgi:ribosomal protein L11 methyltransferase